MGRFRIIEAESSAFSGKFTGDSCVASINELDTRFEIWTLETMSHMTKCLCLKLRPFHAAFAAGGLQGAGGMGQGREAHVPAAKD